MKFYVTERIGQKRSYTPEGFLLCSDVPIARTGVMDYHESELPLESDRGVIRVERHEEDVFSEKAMASFSGKPVVIDHPSEDVNPDNWRSLAIGSVQNVHRGEGAFADVLMADLLITDKAGIQAVLDGKVQVSCGYDADYRQLKPGLARQHAIVGNHVALVEQGRCGPRCSIGDQAMSITLKEGQMPAIAKKKVSWKDRFLAAMKSKDEAAMEKLAGEVTDDEGEIAESEVQATPSGGVTINIGGAGAPKPEAAADESPDAPDPLKDIKDMLAAFGERLSKLESARAPSGDADGDKDDDDSEATADADGEEEDKDDKKEKTGDARPTRDSKVLLGAFQDTIARAEILVPGVKVPTFDAKADIRKTRDALCAFRRKVLDKAYASDEGKAAIDPLLAGEKLSTRDMSCDAAAIMFTAASENMKALNRSASASSGSVRFSDSGAAKPTNIAELNKQAGNFWKK